MNIFCYGFINEIDIEADELKHSQESRVSPGRPL